MNFSFSISANLSTKSKSTQPNFVLNEDMKGSSSNESLSRWFFGPSHTGLAAHTPSSTSEKSPQAAYSTTPCISGLSERCAAAFAGTSAGCIHSRAVTIFSFCSGDSIPVSVQNGQTMFNLMLKSGGISVRRVRISPKSYHKSSVKNSPHSLEFGCTYTMFRHCIHWRTSDTIEACRRDKPTVPVLG